MGKEHRQDSEISSMLSSLHITRSTTRKRHPKFSSHTSLRHADSRKMQSLQTLLLDISPEQQMTQSRDPIDYPMLLQISDLLRDTPVLSEPSGPSDIDLPKMRAYIGLLRTCGLTSELHYTLLKEWSSTTSRFLVSPVFSCGTYWSTYILKISVRFSPLHCAILAVSALQYVRLSPREEAKTTIVQTAYRLRAEADRRLLHFKETIRDSEETIATVFCLLLFDYLTGNIDEWIARISQAKIMMKAAKFSSFHPVGCHYFWTIARHDQLASYMGETPCGFTNDDLLWDEGQLISDAREFDKVGLLHMELIRILGEVVKLSPQSTESDYLHIEDCLTTWRGLFPLSLQTYEYMGDVFDDSCFSPAQSCAGGPRAIAIHCLYAETMIKLLLVSPIEFQRSKIHEHAMTVCKLAQSLTSSELMLSNSLPADISQLSGSLFVAGQHVFSAEGKRWATKNLRWIATTSGNLVPETMAGLLESRWREVRTRPREIDIDMH